MGRAGLRLEGLSLDKRLAPKCCGFNCTEGYDYEGFLGPFRNVDEIEHPKIVALVEW